MKRNPNWRLREALLCPLSRMILPKFVEVGVRFLKHLLDAFHGDERLALAGWYQGERAVRAHGLYKVTKPFVANVLALKSRM